MNLKHTIIFTSLVLGAIGLVSSSFIPQSAIISGEDKVLDILHTFKIDMPLHFIPNYQLDSAKVNQGKNLVTTGFLDPENKKIFELRQSKHFVCVDCHNIEREDPDLMKSNPETRLKYISEKEINFLPATTLYGTVNKSHWYNDDYQKKYGDLVDPARDTLVNAVQLCAVVCSQGRALNQQEMNAVLHFLNSIGYNYKDLNLTKKETNLINNSTNIKKKKELIESKYLDYSPATFMIPQKIENRKFGENGNPKTGKLIYDMSCLTCHKEGGVTNYKLNSDQLTFKHLKYWSRTHKAFSVYDITRKGTYSKNGYKPYMPNYTKERMSDKQLEDLMAYIQSMASKKTIENNKKTTQPTRTSSF